MVALTADEYLKSFRRYRELVNELHSKKSIFRDFVDQVKDEFRNEIGKLGIKDFPSDAFQRCKEIVGRWVNAHFGYFMAYLFAKFGTYTSSLSLSQKKDVKSYDDTGTRTGDYVVDNQRTVSCSEDGVNNLFKKLVSNHVSLVLLFYTRLMT